MSQSAVFLCTSPMFGGDEKSFVVRAGELARRGHRITVLVSSETVASRAREAGLTDVRWTRRGGDLDVLALSRYVRHLRAVRPDALFVANKRDFWLGSLAGWIAGVSRVVLSLGIERRFRSGPKYRIVFSGLADHLVVNARSMQTKLLRESPFIPADRVVVIPNGHPIPKDRQRSNELRLRLGLPADAILVGGAGRLARQKGFDLGPEFISLLRERWPVHLAIAGDGPERDGLRQAIRGQGLGDRIHLLGHLDDMSSFYRGIDLFVLFSRYEGMANVLGEAMSYGVPVIATRVSGSEELLREGELGALVDIGDVGGLADAADRLFRAGLERSERLVEHIRVHYSLERMVDETEKVLFAAPRSKSG